MIFDSEVQLPDLTFKSPNAIDNYNNISLFSKPHQNSSISSISRGRSPSVNLISSPRVQKAKNASNYSPNVMQAFPSMVQNYSNTENSSSLFSDLSSFD
ncbi:hypothetical protein AYI70_g3386, partial [Smittium culicis]